MTKAKLTVSLPSEVLQQARATVVGVQRQVDPSFTLTQLVTDALQAHIDQLQQEHHGGQPWTRADRLRPGRPLGE